MLFIVQRGWNGGEVIKEQIARGKGGGKGKERGRGLMPSRVLLWPIINGIYIREAHVLSNEWNLVVYRSRKRDVMSFLDIKHLNS